MTWWQILITVVVLLWMGGFCVGAVMLAIGKKRAEREELKRLEEDEKRYFEALLESWKKGK